MQNNTDKFQTDKVISISASHLFHDTYSAFLAPLLPLLIDKLGISLSMAGFLDIVRKLPSLFNPFIGLLADKICVRYFVILAPALTALAMSFLGVASNYFTLVILLLIAGISNTLYHVPAPVMVKKVSGSQIGRGMSFYMFGGEMARTLGPLLITAAIAQWGLEGSYRVLPIGIVASIVLFFKLRNIKITDRMTKKKESKATATFMKLLPFFIIITGFTVFRSITKLALTLYLPTYLTQKGHTLWLTGISLSILQFSGATGSFLAGSISDRIGRKNSLLIASTVNPILMILFVFAKGIFMIPLLILIGFFLIATTPVVLALVQETNTEHPSFVNGVYMTINFGISSLVVLLIGFLGDHFGLELTYKICALTSAGAIPFVLFLKK